MASLSYLSFLRIKKKKSAVLYRPITLIALHLLREGASSIFDWLQNLHWIRGKSLTNLSHWSPTYPPICMFFEWRRGNSFPSWNILNILYYQFGDPRRASLEHFWSHFIKSSAWPWNSQTGGHLSTWGRPEGAQTSARTSLIFRELSGLERMEDPSGFPKSDQGWSWISCGWYSLFECGL